MLVKNIKYLDFRGIEREDTFYFNLTEEELLNMNYGVPGGMEASLRKIVDQADINGAAIMKFVTDYIEKSYGELSEDGKYFIKYDPDGKSLGLKFKQSAAFSALFKELLASPDATSEFVYSVMPTELGAEARKIAAETESQTKRAAAEAMVEIAAGTGDLV